MRTSPLVTAHVVLLVLAACSTTGNKFDIAKVDQLQPGISTSADAIQLLGPPTSESSFQNGTRLLQWQYAQGTLIGGSGAHVAILFDATAKMVRVTHKFSTK